MLQCKHCEEHFEASQVEQHLTEVNAKRTQENPPRKLLTAAVFLAITPSTHPHVVTVTKITWCGHDPHFELSCGHEAWCDQKCDHKVGETRECWDCPNLCKECE